MKYEGYVKDHRSILDWEWFTEPNTAHLWEYIRLAANYRTETWRGIEIPAGSFITTLNSLSAKTGLSVQNVRTSLKKLQATHEIVVQVTNKYTLITIEKWALYQGCTEELTRNSTHTSTCELTKNKNIRNKNIYSKEKINKKEKFGEYQNVLLTEEERAKLFDSYGFEMERYIKFLDEYIEMKGYKAKSHYLAIKKWVVDAVRENDERSKARPIVQVEINPDYNDSVNPVMNEEELRKWMESIR